VSSRFLVVYSRIEPHLSTKLGFISSNGHRAKACQFGDLANELSITPEAAETTTVSPGLGRLYQVPK
jgi:hypothetical protein